MQLVVTHRELSVSQLKIQLSFVYIISISYFNSCYLIDASIIYIITVMIIHCKNGPGLKCLLTHDV
jgi:hypothetical protein